MITEQLLDAVIDELETSAVDPQDFYEQRAVGMPLLVTYLTDADTRLLTDQEHDYLLYLGMVLLKAIDPDDDVDPVLLEEHEEQVWALVNTHGADAPDRIAEQWDNHVVIEFILDAVELDEDYAFLTEPGAQLMLVKLVTLTACLLP